MEKRITCIFCDSDAIPTDEHVVPEFAGGSLIIKDVCKTCNDKMGSDFEGPISRSLLFRLPRHFHGIQGKAHFPVNPFPAVGLTDDGRKVVLDEEMKPRLQTSLEEREHESGGVEINLSVDVSEKHKISKILEDKIRRMARKKWPNMTKAEVDTRVAQALSSIPVEPVIKSEQPTIKYSESINLNALFLLFMKVAFEVTVYHHGREVISDAQTTKLRAAINNRDTKAEVHGQFFPNPDPFSLVPFPDNSHVVLLYENACYVRLFDFYAIFQVVSDRSRYVLSADRWTAYWFDYVKRNYRQELLLQYIVAQV